MVADGIGWKCISCGGDAYELFKLGDFYLCDFVDPGESRGDRYPLRLVMCDEDCGLIQLGEIVPRDKVITDRYGFFSGLNEQNRRDLKDNAAWAVRHAPPFSRQWLDIGCNDGTLLGSAPSQMHRVGVDPLLKYDNFRGEACRHMDEMIAGYFDPGVFGHGDFDVVTSTAMFYALDKPGEFVEGVRRVLSTRGVWVIQQNYAPDMIRNNTVDNIIHEHVAYYTMRSLQHLMHEHGLDICDVAYSDVKGGCFRVAVHHRGAHTIRSSVEQALFTESTSGAYTPARWQAWGRVVRRELQRTRALLTGLAGQDEPVFCLGAGNRGGTLVQLLGDDPSKLLRCAVERSEQKVGKVWTSAGIPIISEDQFRADPPGHMLVSPWFFRENIVPRERAYLEGGGTMIFPLPHFELVTA